MAKRCKVFTPAHVAQYMLDVVGYMNDLMGKRVLENSCGSGNILCAIVRRYIIASSDFGHEVIKRGLEQDIVGYDVDEDCCIEAKKNLDQVAAEYGIHGVNWNIHCKDALLADTQEGFDFVIGNPPYISYRSLDESTRVSLRKRFSSCKVGAFDYCYAFIEHSLTMLKNGGRMIYLIPSSIFKNVHGCNLRDLMKEDLVEIHDYTAMNVFDEALTSSALAYFVKDNSSPSIRYLDLSNKKECLVPKSSLTHKWMFVNDRQESNTRQRFGDHFCSSIVIATLLNSAFVLSKYTEHGDTIIVNDKPIEREATRNAVSPRLLRRDGRQRIIFPYRYVNGQLIHYTKDEYQDRFPLAAQYLEGFREKLAKRDADKNAQWFEYGRSQALQRINQEKLLISTVVTGKVEVYSLQPEDVPYAGIMITCKGTTSLETARRILQSEDFLTYVQSIGTYANGHSLRITPKDIDNYQFPMSLLDPEQ